VAHTETDERDRALIASRQKGDLTLARIAGVPAGEAGIGVKLAYYFTRRGMAKLAGRETEQMLEPLAIFAILRSCWPATEGSSRRPRSSAVSSRA
jgi:hypothetical protein